MKLQTTIALAVAALGLGVAPTALATGPNYTPEYTPTPPPPSPHGKAYGVYCRGQSKKHVQGEKGTAFSRCVKAMAQAAKHEHMAPGRACRAESKEHVKGQQGTSFSRCVKGVAQLRKDLQQEAQA
jgi:hypothetical protein